MQNSPPYKSQTSTKTEFRDGLRRHLSRTKPVIYGCILAVGISQIIIREYFPEVHPPWHLLGGALLVLGLSYLLIPPLLLLIRLARTPKVQRPSIEI